MTETLLPCPFCGSDQVSKSQGHTADGKPWLYIECEACAATAEPNLWNRRAAQPSVPHGWSVKRVGDAIHIEHPNGQWCGYMLSARGGPAHDLTYDFLNAMLTAAPTPPADVHAQQPSRNPITLSILRDDSGDEPAYCIMAAYRTWAEAKAVHQFAREKHAQRDANEVYAPDHYRAAYEEWTDKTEFIQAWVHSGKLPARYLGWHRADIMRDLIERQFTQPDPAIAGDDPIDVLRLERLASYLEEMARVLPAGDDSIKAKDAKAIRSLLASKRVHPASGEDATPDMMFWDADDPERCQDSIHNVIVEVECNRGINVGDIVEVQRAIRLPNISVRITAVDGDGDEVLEFEEIDAAMQQERQP